MIPAGIKVYGEGRTRYKPGDVIPAHLLTKNKKLKETIDEKGKKYADRKAKAASARKADGEKRQKAIKDRRAKIAAEKLKLSGTKAPEKVEAAAPPAGNANAGGANTGSGGR